jgi:hypothetical protein
MSTPATAPSPTRVQQFDYAVNLLRALLWQDNNTPEMTAVLQAKQTWYDTNVSTFWSDWVKDVFDIRTANQFGLAVWAIVLGVPTTVILPPTTKANFGFGIPPLLVDAIDARSTWTPANGVTVTPGQTDPNGATNAVTVNLSTGTGSARAVKLQTVPGGVPAGSTTFTFQAKLVSGTQGTITSDINGVTAAWPALTTGVWTTVTLTINNATAGTTNVNLISPTASAANLEIYWPRMAAGAIVSNGNLNFNNGNFGSNSSQQAALTLNQQRILLLLRYFGLTTLPSVTLINEGLARILSQYGKMYVLDTLNMSYVTYVFGFQPDSDLSFVLNNFDVLPRPAAVGVRFLIAVRPTFGFGTFNKNFNNGTFAS